MSLKELSKPPVTRSALVKSGSLLGYHHQFLQLLQLLLYSDETYMFHAKTPAENCRNFLDCFNK